MQVGGCAGRWLCNAPSWRGRVGEPWESNEIIVFTPSFRGLRSANPLSSSRRQPAQPNRESSLMARLCTSACSPVFHLERRIYLYIDLDTLDFLAASGSMITPARRQCPARSVGSLDNFATALMGLERNWPAWYPLVAPLRDPSARSRIGRSVGRSGKSQENARNSKRTEPIASRTPTSFGRLGFSSLNASASTIVTAGSTPIVAIVNIFTDGTIVGGKHNTQTNFRKHCN